MFSSNALKIFCLVGWLPLLSGCQSCGFGRASTGGANTPAPTPFAAETFKTAIPFETKEPEIYQTEIVTTDAAGASVAEKIFAARSGANRVLIFDYQTDDETADLRTAENRNFLINRRRKICAEKAGDAGRIESSGDFLTGELLSRQSAARFETLGAENGLDKYLARLGDAANSEIIIYVDRELGLPVKQEFYAGAGERKVLTLVTELKNFAALVDQTRFEMPKDCRRVSLKEFYEIGGAPRKITK